MPEPRGSGTLTHPQAELRSLLEVSGDWWWGNETHTVPSFPCHPVRNAPTMKLLLRLLALSGVAVSAYLFYLKLNGTITSVAGCGGGSDCANVLGSHSKVMSGVAKTTDSFVNLISRELGLKTP